MPYRSDSSHTRHSIPWIIVSRLFGLAIYFIIIAVLSQLHFSNSVVESIILFLISPAIIVLVVTFSILFLVGEVFLALDFPLSLPGPFFNALGSVFLVSFLFQLLYLVDRIGGITIFSLFRPLEPLLYFLVFLIVLIVQYVHLFSRGERYERENPEYARRPATGPSQEGSSHPSPNDQISWDEVGAEFRNLMYDFFHALRESLRKK